MKTVALIWLSFLTLRLAAQDKAYAKSVIATLCSEEMAGRGYVNDGDKKAATFISSEFKKAGLQSFGPDYFQSFGFPVNTFPGQVDVMFDETQLMPGEDFIVSPGCSNVNGVFPLIWIDSALVDNTAEFEKVEKQFLRNTFLVIDGLKEAKCIHTDRVQKILSNQVKARGLVFANQEKLTWSVATEWDAFPKLYVMKGQIKRYQLKMTIKVLAEIKTHGTQNVIGYIKGSTYPDSFIVLTAHYDHLGKMGNWALFPGANDNASGTAMMLDMAKYFSKNKPAYSIVFMAFAGEEAGLFGSYYYTEHPLFSLKDISMLINLDLMGTGDKGMTVVNATVFPQEFQQLQVINITNGYLDDVKSRGKAKNSDHYYFTEKGVKSFFFYLMGDYHFYHDVFDTAEALPLSKYDQAFSLIRDFITELQHK